MILEDYFDLVIMKTEYLTNGLFTDYYKNGQIKTEGYYKDTKRTGKWIWWNENGQKDSEIYYKDGKCDGKWTWWHDNCQKKLEGYYRNENRNGKWIYWYKKVYSSCSSC